MSEPGAGPFLDNGELGFVVLDIGSKAVFFKISLPTN
jgi:hypothetical protein